jgi:hypothetical protein
MKKSRFFAELSNTYASEIDDLLSDSEGKTVLQKRLKEKRDEIHSILPMIEFAPEMVAVVFYDAFHFQDSALLLRAITSEPGRPDFPQWKVMKGSLSVAEWALPLVDATLREEGGDIFLVTTVALEFLRLQDAGDQPAAKTDDAEKAESDGEDDDEDRDLSEAGADWMAQQGFDTPER